MYPHERSLVKQLADKPFAIVGVNSDGDLDEIRKTVKEKNITWRSFQNEGGDTPISEQWNVRGWPTIYLLDSAGKIRYNGVRGDKLDDAITKLLAEAGHEVSIKHDDEDESGQP